MTHAQALERVSAPTASRPGFHQIKNPVTTWLARMRHTSAMQNGMDVVYEDPGLQLVASAIRASASSSSRAGGNGWRVDRSQAGSRVEVTSCGWCETPVEPHFSFCPKCGRPMAVLRLFKELLDRGMDERDVRAVLLRAGFEPFS